MRDDDDVDQLPIASADTPLDALRDDDDDDGDWLCVASATTPLDVVLRRIDDRTTRALAEFLDTIAADPDLTAAERADIRAYLDHVTPMLRERARADARRAHARLRH